MKTLRFTLISIFLVGLISNVKAQEEKPMPSSEKMINSMELDTTISKTLCGAPCFRPIIQVGARYYTDAMSNTRTTLANNGFILDQEAIEYQVRFYNLPKMFFYNQTGTLQSSRYASVIGFGFKENLKYNLIQSENFFLEPFFEAGLGYFQLNIVEGIARNSIASVLTEDLKSLSLGNFTATGDVGMSIGGRFNVGNSRFTILAQGGYVVNYPTQWRAGSSLAFREKINIGSPYFGATIKLDLSCSQNTCCSGTSCCK